MAERVEAAGAGTLPSGLEAEDPDLATSDSRRRSLVSGGTYALANAAQRALAFILLPLYTTVLSPAEYGRLGLLITIQSGATVALAGGMEAAVLRGFFHRENDPAARRRFVISAWNLLLVVVPIMALITAVLLVVVVSGSSVFRPSEAALAVCVAATFVAATVVPLTILRAEQRLKDYIVMTAITGASTTVLTVLFVVVLRLGVGGWLVASFMSNCVCLIVALKIIPWGRIDSFDRDGIRAALSLAIPLIPHAASSWSLQLADRIMLATLVSASALGVYTLGANMALPALVVIQSLNYGFLPSYARHQADPEAVRDLRDTITLQVLLVLVICCSIALLGAPVVGLVSPTYVGAAVLIPWLVLGYAFLGFYYVPMNAVSLVAGRTTFVWILTVMAAAVNLGAIYIFAPDYGVIAAAVASALGYFVLFALTALYARALDMRLSIDWRRIVPATVVVGMTFGVGDTLISTGSVVDLIARAGLVMTLPVTIILACGYSLGDAVLQARRLAKRILPGYPTGN